MITDADRRAVSGMMVMFSVCHDCEDNNVRQKTKGGKEFCVKCVENKAKGIARLMQPERQAAKGLLERVEFIANQHDKVGNWAVEIAKDAIKAYKETTT